MTVERAPFANGHPDGTDAQSWRRRRSLDPAVVSNSATTEYRGRYRNARVVRELSSDIEIPNVSRTVNPACGSMSNVA